MTLRRKTLLIIGVTVVGMVAILYVVSTTILLNSFAALEEQSTRQHVERVLSALSGDISNLDNLAADWAKWDDTYAFIEESDDDYVQANLVDETFRNSRLNLILFIHSSGRLVFGKMYDLQAEKEVPVPQSMLERLTDDRADTFLRNQPDAETSVTGLMLLPEGPLIVVAWPILTSEGLGPSRGTLIMGRYLSAAEIERLAEQTHLSLAVQRFGDPQMPSDFRDVCPSLVAEGTVCVCPLDENLVAGYALIEDIYGEPGVVVRATTPREVYQQGQVSVRYVLLAILGGSLVMGVVTLALLERLVLSRLARLGADVRRIGDSRDPSARVSVTGGDELADLAEAINGVLEALEESAEALQQSLDKTRKQAQRVRQIMDTVPEGVLLLNADLRVLLANPVARLYLPVLTNAKIGEPLAHLGGQPVTNLLAAPQQGLWHEVMIGEFPRRIFEVAARPMKAGAEAGGWVLMLRDVTQERADLQRAQAQARLAAVGQLAAGIAHDFNNILTGIVGYAELLQRRPDTSAFARERLQIIGNQGQQGAQLVRQILDFSRQSISERYPLDLLPFLRETFKLLRRTIPENIAISFSCDPGEYWINADPTQIQQVLMNLAVNARDAMPRGGELNARLSRLTAGVDLASPDALPSVWFALTITDTGTGIAPEHIPHLFEPFFTTKEVGKGTGLGLAQVYGLITQHGGSVDVSSTPGEGTTFTIYLPSLDEERVAVPTAVETEPAGRRGETILLVEDEPSVLGVGKAMLEQIGYRVHTAVNGEDALRVYDQHHNEIDLVLTDIVMPQMDGVMLLETLRKRDPTVKVIVTSGYPLEGETRELLAAESVGWLRKPLRMAQLIQVIDHAIGRAN